MKFFLIAFLFINFCLSNLDAQKIVYPQNPKTKGEIEYEPQNKENLGELLTVGRKYMAHFYAHDSVKNYSKALKWLEKAHKINPDSANWELFLINWVGGYGRKPDWEEAQVYLPLIRKDLTLRYAYQTDISIRNLPDLHPKATQSLDHQELMMVARLLAEYHISYPLAQWYAHKAQEQGNPDAAYWKAKWALDSVQFRQPSAPATYQTQWLALAEQYAQKGSPTAKLTFVYLAGLQHQIFPNHKITSLLSDYLQPDSTDRGEKQLKALCLSSTVQKGRDKLNTFCQLLDFEANHDLKAFPFSHPFLQEAHHFDDSLRTVSGLLAVLHHYQIADIQVDTALYRQNFKGNYQQMINWYNQLAEPNNLSFIRPKHYQMYAPEIKYKLGQLLEQQHTIESFVMIYKAISAPQNAAWISPLEKSIFRKKIFDHIVRLFEKVDRFEQAIIPFEKIRQEKLDSLTDQASLDFYKSLINKRFQEIVSETTRPLALVEMLREFSKSELKRSFFPTYHPTIAEKIYSLTGSVSDTIFHCRKVALELTRLTSFEQGRTALDTLKSLKNWQPEHLKTLTSWLKTKLMTDVYGETPSPSVFAAVRDKLKKYTWIEPEGTAQMNKWVVANEVQKMQTIRFLHLDSAKKYMDQQINRNLDLTHKNLKDTVLGIFRQKTIVDLVGEKPSSEQINELHILLNKTAWLNPEGRQVYWRYVTEMEIPRLEGRVIDNFGTARQLYDSIAADKNRPPKFKEMLFSVVRRKVIRAIYADNPPLSQINELGRRLLAETWLLPEGQQLYLAYKNNSHYSFSDILTSADSLQSYFYQVEKEDELPYWDLKIYKILPFGAGKNLIYSSRIELTQPNADTWQVWIQYWRNIEGTINWLEYKNHHLAVLYRRSDPHIHIEAVGNKFVNLTTDQSHHYPLAALLAKNTSQNFEAKNAMRAAIRYFTFQYRRYMLP